MTHEMIVILTAALSIVFLLFLILKCKISEVLALLITSIVVGLAVGMTPEELWATVESGMAGTLGFLAVVISVGTMFGEILRVTGGTQSLAHTLFNKFGDRKVIWALGLVGMLIAVPIFMEVAIVLFAPIVYSLARSSKRPVTYFAIPLVAGIAISYSTIPPAGGALAGAVALDAEVGLVILFSIIAGVIAMLVAGPIYGSFISKKVAGGIPESMEMDMSSELSHVEDEKHLPNFGSVILTFALPLILMIIRSICNLTLPEGNTVRSVMELLGHPFGALILVCLLAMYVFGIRQGFSMSDMQAITSKALEPAGMILLITGAGGVFGEVLVQSGVGDIIADFADQIGLPLMVLAFITAMFIRAAQGSATVAIVTTATLMQPLTEAAGYSVSMVALMSSVIGFGSISLSHLNDSGYWIVCRYFGMTEVETLKTWTVMETIIGFVGFGVCMIISLFL